jgi:hypothetical protein
VLFSEPSQSAIVVVFFVAKANPELVKRIYGPLYNARAAKMCKASQNFQNSFFGIIAERKRKSNFPS